MAQSRSTKQLTLHQVHKIVEGISTKLGMDDVEEFQEFLGKLSNLDDAQLKFFFNEVNTLHTQRKQNGNGINSQAG